MGVSTSRGVAAGMRSLSVLGERGQTLPWERTQVLGLLKTSVCMRMQAQ